MKKFIDFLFVVAAILAAVWFIYDYLVTGKIRF